MLRDGRTIFNALAEQYDAYRPHYPAEALSFLVTLGELDGSSDVADIGSGTGRIALELAKYVRVVYAVDSASAMLEQLNTVASDLHIGNIRIVEAPGEETTLPTNSIDLAIMAQSFHWMNKPVALGEMHRIIRDNKMLVVMWNQVSNTSDEYYKNIVSVIKRYNNTYKGGSDIISSDFQPSIEASGKFGPVERFTFPFTLHYSAEAYIGFLLSKSYIGVGIPQDKLPYFIEEVHQLLRDQFSHGNVTEHYDSVILATRKR